MVTDHIGGLKVTDLEKAQSCCWFTRKEASI